MWLIYNSFMPSKRWSAASNHAYAISIAKTGSDVICDMVHSQVEITHRIAWRRNRADTGGYCSQATIDSRTLLGSGNTLTLNCRVGCTGQVGYMSYYCTDFSITENWSAGQRTYIYNFGTDLPYFEVS